MTTGSVARLTLAVCLCAAIVETFLGFTSTFGLKPDSTPILLFVIGPYLLLALFAWQQRDRPTASWVLLAVAVGMSAVWGLCVFGEVSYRYHTDLHYRMVFRLAVSFVPLVQWAIVLVVGLVLLVGWLIARTKEVVMNWDQRAQRKLRERYGYAKEEAERELDNFARDLKS
jgi:uncharacterized membrane protein